MIHFMTDETRTERFGNQICTIHNVDGYTTRKTILGAVHEIGKAIAKIDAGEGELLTNVKTEAEAKETLVPNRFVEHGTSYCFELEEVSCASEWDEENEEMRYEEGNFYFHIRFFVWEEVEEEQETTEATEAPETAEENETATAEATATNESGKSAAAPDPEMYYCFSVDVEGKNNNAYIENAAVWDTRNRPEEVRAIIENGFYKDPETGEIYRPHEDEAAEDRAQHQKGEKSA